MFEHDPNIDPRDEHLHKVSRMQMERYAKGKLPKVKAECGKTWTPTIPTNLNKTRCKLCFPSMPNRFCIAS